MLLLSQSFQPNKSHFNQTFNTGQLGAELNCSLRIKKQMQAALESGADGQLLISW